MSDNNKLHRRSFLGAAAASIVAAEVSSLGTAYTNTGQPKRLPPLGPIKQIKAGVLDVGYCDMGSSDGPPVLLLHGWPYDIHSYADVAPMLGYPQYEELEKRLTAQPAITVPAITLDGDADGVVLATDGKSTAPKFVGGRQHRVIPNVGHNLPQEDPTAFAAAVWELVF